MCWGGVTLGARPVEARWALAVDSRSWVPGARRMERPLKVCPQTGSALREMGRVQGSSHRKAMRGQVSGSRSGIHGQLQPLLHVHLDLASATSVKSSEGSEPAGPES